MFVQDFRKQGIKCVHLIIKIIENGNIVKRHGRNENTALAHLICAGETNSIDVMTSFRKAAESSVNFCSGK